MTDWYAPNQQAVRDDGSGPAEEGSGGSGPVEEEVTPSEGMTKAELVEEAERRGLEVPASATKADLVALLEG